MIPGVTGAADISECGTYRYWLTRTWGPGPVVCFVMLNPSTADADEDDPTLTRCRCVARGEGYDGLRVVNLFALRSPSPRVLLYHPEPAGPGNDQAVIDAVKSAAGVIVAWGANASLPKLRARRNEVLPLLAEVPLGCFGMTRDGEPRHPVRLALRTPIVPWEAR
jgi:hypothetical protein